MERIISYKEFTKKVTGAVESFYAGSARVGIRKVEKNNGVVRDSLFVLFDTDRVTPVLYMEDLYRRLKSGVSLRTVIKEVLDVYENNRSQLPFDPERLSCFDQVSGTLAYRLVNADRNEKMLKEVPHSEYLDLALVYMCVIKSSDYGNGSMLVTNALLEAWDVDKGELEIKARENARDTLPPTVKSLVSVLKDSFGISEFPDVFDMKVITNSLGLYGASAVCYEGVLGELAESLEDDLVLLPSSVHEMLALPASKVSDYDEMRELVKSVNLTEVSPQEYLSDNVYFYDRSLDRLEVCG